MKRVTIEEYDEQGRLRSRRVEEDGALVQGWWTCCTCPSTYCPLHSRIWQPPYWITVGQGTTSGTFTLTSSGTSEKAL